MGVSLHSSLRTGKRRAAKPAGPGSGIGLWVVFGHANPVAIAAVVAVALAVHLFVVFYEEPTLRRKFGAEYEEYCRNVRRWWPRVRGWDTPK